MAVMRIGRDSHVYILYIIYYVTSNMCLNMVVIKILITYKLPADLKSVVVRFAAAGAK